MNIDINEDKEQLLIKYTDIDNNMNEEWINIHFQRIAQIGKYTSGINSGNLITAEEINKKLFKNRKFITLNMMVIACLELLVNKFMEMKNIMA